METKSPIPLLLCALSAAVLVLNVVEDLITVKRAHEVTTETKQLHASSATEVVLNVLLVVILPARGAIIYIIYKQ
jgi:hypothetical protein